MNDNTMIDGVCGIVSASFQSPINPGVTEHAQIVYTGLFTPPAQEPGNKAISDMSSDNF